MFQIRFFKVVYITITHASNAIESAKFVEKCPACKFDASRETDIKARLITNGVPPGEPQVREG